MIHRSEEKLRLKVLKEYDILDKLPEEIYEDIPQIASMICNMPVAMVSLVDKESQFFKSRVGVGPSETPIEQAVCYHTVLAKNGFFEVADLRLDERFNSLPFFSNVPHLVSCYGVPLVNPAGIAFGSLCVLSTDEVVTISQVQKNTLKKLANQIIYILELRKKHSDFANYHIEVQKYGQEMEEFAYTAAHDLRSPLRAVNSFLKLIESKCTWATDDKEKMYFKFIFDSAKRMDNLIVDLLDYAKSNKTNKEKELIDVYLLVTDIFSGLIDETTIDKPILLTNNLPEITGSKVAINMIFQNLIDNALKYQSKDNIAMITINYVDEIDRHVFEVVDNGIGIADEYIALIFQPFKRLHTQSEYMGSGLGLAAVKKMVESIDGEISITSKVGEGSVFTFSIPK